ncbi:MAG: serine/threonine protein kinase [Deltaproteobacteria bacterium]|nr:serine/threonine protein kinase [Deltaproteobacteria bacterium]
MPFEVLVDADEGSGDGLTNDSTVDDSELGAQVRSELEQELKEPLVVQPGPTDFDELSELLSSPARKEPIKPKRPEPLMVPTAKREVPGKTAREDTAFASTLIRPERWDGEAPTALDLLGDDLDPGPKDKAATMDRPIAPPVLDPGLLTEVPRSLPAPGRDLFRTPAPLLPPAEDGFTEVADVEDSAGQSRRTNDPLFEQLLPVPVRGDDDQGWMQRQEQTEVAPAPDTRAEPGVAPAPVAPAPASEPTSERPDVVGGKYKVTGVLGEGAMGTVYAAEHQLLGQQVAVKVVHDAEPTLIDRLRREAEALARMKHPGIVTIHDYDVMPDGRPYIVMELLEGEDLATRLERVKKMSCEDAASLGVSIAEALGAAHAVGVVHRDLKPANVILQQGSHLKLIDFGTATVRDRRPLTVAGAIVGTPAYMAPEQVSGGLVTERTDVHALGLLMYELVTGSQPFHGDRFEQSLAKVLGSRPEPPSKVGASSDVLDGIVARALEKDPAQRFQTMEEMAGALRTAAAKAHSATDIAASSSSSPGWPKWWIAVGALAAVAAAVAALTLGS